MKFRFSDVAVVFFYVVVLYMLVRPSSPASTWISQMTEAMTALTTLAVAP